jgi:hypothetical protein
VIRGGAEAGHEASVIVPLKPGWEKWRVAHIKKEAERLFRAELHEEDPIAYLSDTDGAALYAMDLLGDLELIPRRKAATVRQVGLAHLI